MGSQNFRGVAQLLIKPKSATDGANLENKMSTPFDVQNMIDVSLDESLMEELSAAEAGFSYTCSFTAAGVLTTDAGLVIRMQDGSEFQVTIVQSRGAS